MDFNTFLKNTKKLILIKVTGAILQNEGRLFSYSKRKIVKHCT
jgi:hypothetical protein